MMSKGIVLLFGILGAALCSATPFAVTETTDFSGIIFGPTNLGVTMDVGVNTITGSLSGGSDNNDQMSFSTGGIPISSIRIIVTNFTGTTNFSVLQTGLQSGAAAVFVTGNGTYLLPLTLPSGNTVAFIVIPPVGPSAGVSGAFNYTIEIVGAPEPSTFPLIALSLTALIGLRVAHLRRRG